MRKFPSTTIYYTHAFWLGFAFTLNPVSTRFKF
jgi:hypothetical protein